MDHEQRIRNLEVEIEVLKRNYRSLAERLHITEEYIDTVSSAFWKRFIWWFQGFYFRKVGRWYAPDWTPRWPK